MSDNELSPFNLTQEQLEEIVIHAAPLTRHRSNPYNTIPEYPGPSWNALCDDLNMNRFELVHILLPLLYKEMAVFVFC
jgi:hypothetical protein